MSAKLLSVMLAMSLLASGAATAYGQSTTFGQFLGTVTDMSGAVVPESASRLSIGKRMSRVRR